MWADYKSLRVQDANQVRNPISYGFTSDILSFRRCPRQYLFFREREFVPPNATQLYFGTVVHQSLDLAHAQFRGLLADVPKGTIAKDTEIYRFFRAVEQGLFANGVRPYQMGPKGGLAANEMDGSEGYDVLADAIGSERASAFCRVRQFNKVMGPVLYRRVLDTECRIDSDRGDFVITGNVDVIATSDGGGVELWDYKSSKSRELSEDTREGKDARMQIRIYSFIYGKRTGQIPRKGVIYCLGDIEPDSDQTLGDLQKSIIEVDNLRSEDEFNDAIDEFSSTVREIETARNSNSWSNLPPREFPGKKTCDGCAVRWSCKYAKGYGLDYPKRYP